MKSFFKKIGKSIQYRYYSYKLGKFLTDPEQRKHLIKTNPKMSIEVLWWKWFQKRFPWKKPQTLNEKINWLSGATDTSLWTQYTDKYEVRKHIEELGLRHILTRCYGVWNNVEDIDFDELPDSYVLKCTHDSGSTIVVRDKYKDLDIVRIKEKLNRHLRKHYGYDTFEPHYARITPRVMCEEFLSGVEEMPPIDYKFLCLNGIPVNCMVCTDRIITEGGKSYKTFYSIPDWKPMRDISSKEWVNENYKRIIDRPENLHDMIHFAKILSKGFPVVRIDLYNVQGKVYFGEMTFTPHGGILDYLKEKYQRIYGEMVKI